MELATGHFVLATSYSRTACRRTTIGAAAFHFRVRNGNGWCHYAIVTRAEQRLRCSALVCDSRFIESLHRQTPTGPCLQPILDSRFTIHIFKEPLILWHLHTGKRFTCFKASFCFEIFRFPLLLRTCSEQRIGKVKDQAERVISTPELNTLLCLHPEPINVVVYHDPSGRSHLGIGLALRCFQRLSFPNIATQRCR